MRKLADPEEPLKVFFGRARLLKEKLGAVLWQLPPGLRFDREKFLTFLRALTRYETRSAFEVRNESWVTDEVSTALDEHGMNLSHHDRTGLPVASPDVFPFLYVRRHGASSHWRGSYSERRLKNDADRISRWRRDGKDVFVYFNNTASSDAVRDALGLIRFLSR